MMENECSTHALASILTSKICWFTVAVFIFINFKFNITSDHISVNLISGGISGEPSKSNSERTATKATKPTDPLEFFLDYSLLENPERTPNKIGCQYTKDCGEILFEFQSTEPPKIEKKKKRMAVLISGSTPRVLIDRTLKIGLMDPNPKYIFEVYVDLIQSSVRGKRYWFADEIYGVNFTSMFVRSFTVRSRPEYPTYWGPEIEISRDKKGGKRQWPWGNNSAHKFPDRGDYYDCAMLNMNKDPLVTKYRLAETVKSFEKRFNFKYNYIFWAREDAAFSNPLPLNFVQDTGLHVKRCMSWGGINDKVFIFHRRHLDVFGNAVSIYYDQNFNVSCINNEKCQQKYYKKHEVKIRRVKELYAICDSLLWKGNLCYRFKYCPGCSIPLEDREFTVHNCPAVLG